MNYYNDNDPKVCQWIRNLIAKGVIPDGYVDQRPIQEINPEDLREYKQVHMFCGIAGWARALELANWPAHWPVWTGSCPCQGFSVAGKRGGIEDPRHLWPVWFELIRKCRPPVIFGEQVAAAIKHGWLDLVCDDLESQGYSCGALVLPACSVGAPHLRQRLWFMAYREQQQLAGGMSGSHKDRTKERGRASDQFAGCCEAGSMAYRCGKGVQEFVRRQEQSEGFDPANGALCVDSNPGTLCGCKQGGICKKGSETQITSTGKHGIVGNACSIGKCGKRGEVHAKKENDKTIGVEISGATGRMDDCDSGQYRQQVTAGVGAQEDKTARIGENDGARRLTCRTSAGCKQHAGDEPLSSCWATAGFWRDTQWVYCTDGKTRPIESGVLPLAHGVSGRMVKIRGYGNAIVPQVAAEVIKAGMAYLETINWQKEEKK